MVWEERWHPLRQEWVMIAAHRNDRPWSGETVQESSEVLPAYDKDCYLCPGNRRVSGKQNPEYGGVFVFDNDKPCVGLSAPTDLQPPPGIYRNQRANGIARVVSFTPRHDLTLAELSYEQVVDLLVVLQEQYRELGAHPEINHVLMFENKGAVVGVSNPHPHSQIYATNFVFKTIEIEVEASSRHFTEHRESLLQSMIRAEEEDGRRILISSDQTLSFIPYCARYPYETFISPREAHGSLAGLSRDELEDFGAVLHDTVVRMDNLWKMSFPYVMVFHQEPTDGKPHPGFHFHVEIHPPLRKPGLLKYLAGPEVGGGNFINDTSPEEKAAELQAVPSVHYKKA
jgi:UDPglucose--hexose-1-phosphate uridylyltransferase